MSPERFTGAVLVQARLLPQVLRIANLPEAQPYRTPSTQELCQFLAFLSLRALTRDLLYDATVPDRYETELLSAACRLGLENNVRPLRESIGLGFFHDLERAAANCSSSVLADLASPPKPFRTIDPRVVDRFFQVGERILGETNLSHRIELAMDAYNGGLMGGKFLVGMAAEENLGTLKEILAPRHKGTTSGEEIMSLCVNRFRAFLLSTWAGQNGALFAAEPAVVDLLGRHRVFLWREIERRLGALADFPAPVGDPAGGSHSEIFPLVGLALLAEADKRSHPIDLVAKADELGRELDLPALHRALLDTQARVSDGQEVEDIADDLWHRVRLRNGPRHEELRPLWKHMAHAVVPAMTISSAAAAASVCAGADPKTAAASFAATSIANVVVAFWQKMRPQDPVAAAISNVVALGADDSRFVTAKVESIWRSRPTG